MTEERIHVLITNEEPFGFSLASPQLPGFLMHRNTNTELRNEFKAALAFAGAPAGMPIQSHVQYRGEAPSGEEFIIRHAMDEHVDERVEVASRLEAMLSTPGEGGRAFAQLKASVTGEYVFVCCVPTDNLGWLTEQLYEQRDTLIVSAAVADRMVFTSMLARSGDIDWPSLTDVGLDFATTVGDLMRRMSVEDNSAPEALVV